MTSQCIHVPLFIAFVCCIETSIGLRATLCYPYLPAQKEDGETKEELQGDAPKAEGSEAEENPAPPLAPPAKKKSAKDTKAAGRSPSCSTAGDILAPCIYRP